MTVSCPLGHLHWLRALGLGLGVLVASHAHAVVYYVDPDQGRDTYTGTAPAADATGQIGPWRTLAKVSSAALAPGDQVLLRCGASWREPLSLMRSGMLRAPIVVSSYPARCVSKPAIDGGMVVPSHAWERHSGNVYKVRLPFSEVPGGDLSGAAAGWRLVAKNGDGAFSANSSSCPGGGSCTTASGGSGGATFSSPAFALRAGQGYTVRYQVWAPAGSTVGVVVRRDAAPNAAQSSYARVSGNGAWQNLDFSLTAPGSVVDARLDVDLPAGRTVYLRATRVEQQLEAGFKVHDMVSSSGVATAAHHPNAGFNSAQPNSVYLKTGVANYVKGPNGKYGSTYVVTGSDLALPAGASIAPGMDVWVRSQIWALRKHAITSVTGNRVFISPQSDYPLIYSGWGYFFTGALWMLDSAGEWYWDASSKTAYMWMPDSGAPGARVTLSTLERAITIGLPDNGVFPNNITISGIAVRHAAEGVKSQRTTSITLRSIDFRNIAGLGVNAEGNRRLTVDSSSFINTASDAISGISSSDTVIANNTILNSGAITDGSGKLLNLPRENFHAIQLGDRARVQGNYLRDVAYNGILVGSDSLVADNSVVNYALVLNDAGAVYAAETSNVEIRNNVFLNGVGNIDGVPSVMTTMVSAIYLDHYPTKYKIHGNTFGHADYCVKIHDAHENQVLNNTCFGARRSTMHLQETNNAFRAAGDVYGNVITGNLLFQSNSGPALKQESSFSTIEDFATFDRNVYAALSSPIVSTDSVFGKARSFTLSEWQRHGAATGRPLEPNGVVAAPVRGFARGTLGTSLVSVAQAASDWSRISSATPAAVITRQATCGPTGGACATISSGGGTATLISPRFPLVKDVTYRISFDAWVSDPAQTLKLQVLRAGPTYESLMGLEPYVFSADKGWKRFSFTFTASADANQARVDFNDIEAGRSLTVANFEVLPYATSGLQAYATLLANPERASQSFNCPLATTRPAACQKFVNFPSGQRVTWPVTLAARASVIVFVQDDQLPDGDGDGVADSQDACPRTTAGTEVNGRGCALGQ